MTLEAFRALLRAGILYEIGDSYVIQVPKVIVDGSRSRPVQRDLESSRASGAADSPFVPRLAGEAGSGEAAAGMSAEGGAGDY